MRACVVSLVEIGATLHVNRQPLPRVFSSWERGRGVGSEAWAVLGAGEECWERSVGGVLGVREAVLGAQFSVSRKPTSLPFSRRCGIVVLPHLDFRTLW